MFTKQHFRKIIFRAAASTQGRRIFHLFVNLIDMPVSRLTKGRFIPSANGNFFPIYYLTMTGAKSNQPRSVPVLCVPDGEALILVGSNWGKARNPSWVYNLRANPKVQVRQGQIKKDLVATELQDGDREAYWHKATSFYPPYLTYEQRAGRLLPVFLLSAKKEQNESLE